MLVGDHDAAILTSHVLDTHKVPVIAPDGVTKLQTVKAKDETLQEPSK